MGQNKSSSPTEHDFRIFLLSRELRDKIWATVIRNDIAFIEEELALHASSVYNYNNNFYRQPTFFNLFLVNRQVKDEVTAVCCQRNVFSFKSTTVAIILLGRRLFSRGNGYMHGTSPAIFLNVGHVSVLPERRLYTNRLPDGSSSWFYEIGRRSTLYFSTTCPDSWRNADSGMTYLCRTIRLQRMKLRSLEIPAAFCLNISVVRALRRLRNVVLNFAFVPESTMLEGLSLEEGTTIEGRRKWLGETGDTDIVLPIYETNRATEPVSAASFACLLAAISREVASIEPIPVSVNQAHVNPPLWMDFSRHQMAADNDLLPPSSGWYKYVAHDPGVCCLERTSPPTQHLLPKRKQLKHCRREMGRMSRENRVNPSTRREQVDKPRVHFIKRSGMRCIVKGKRVGSTHD